MSFRTISERTHHCLKGDFQYCFHPSASRPSFSLVQEDYTTKAGVQTEAGTMFMMLVRHAAISEENFTRAKEFIPER